MNFYRKLYFNVYRFFKKIGKNDDPAFKAGIYLSFAELFYFFSIIFGLDYFGIHISTTHFLPLGLVTAIGLMVFNYFMFVYQDSYLEIEKYFSGKDQAFEKQNVWLTLFLILLPFVLVALLLTLM